MKFSLFAFPRTCVLLNTATAKGGAGNSTPFMGGGNILTSVGRRFSIH